MRRSPGPRALIALAALGALTASSAAALLHNRLTKSAPGKDEKLTASPTAIRL